MCFVNNFLPLRVLFSEILDNFILECSKSHHVYGCLKLCFGGRSKCLVSPATQLHLTAVPPVPAPRARQALQGLAADMKGRVICPRTQEVYPDSQLEKVFVM